MKPVIKATCCGEFKVAYDIGDCYSHWKKTDSPLTDECTFCLLNQGMVGFYPSEEEARNYALSLPRCSAPLVSGRKDEFSTKLL